MGGGGGGGDSFLKGKKEETDLLTKVIERSWVIFDACKMDKLSRSGHPNSIWTRNL